MYIHTYNLFRMIKSKIDRLLNRLLIPILVKYKLVSLLSLLLIFTLKKINKIKPKETKKFKVVILNKGGGTDDLIHSQKKYNKNIEYLQSYRSFFKNIYYTIFEIKNKNSIGTHPIENKVLKKKYVNFLIEFLKVLKEKHKIDAFIGFSFLYFAEKDLQVACSKLKIPFLLLLKESVVTEFEKKYYIYTTRKTNEKFNGYKIAVYSNLAKEMLTKSNYVNKSKVEVVGCSRLSESFSYQKKLPKNQILYYAIQNDRGLPHKFIKQFGNKYFKKLDCYKYYNSKYNWSDLHNKTIKVLKKFAKNNPETSIVIKTKVGVPVNKKDYSDLPDNIQIIYDGIGHQLLEKSKIVIAWNTTSIMEGIAANRFILLPYFHANKNNFRKENELILKLKNRNFGYTEKDFYKKLNYFINLNYNKNKIHNNLFSLEYYLGNVGNNSTLKLNNFLKKNIKN